MEQAVGAGFKMCAHFFSSLPNPREQGGTASKERHRSTTWVSKSKKIVQKYNTIQIVGRRTSPLRASKQKKNNININIMKSMVLCGDKKGSDYYCPALVPSVRRTLASSLTPLGACS